MLGTKTIKALDKELRKNLKQELRDQGHYLTGQLERSLQPTFSENSTGVVLEVSGEDYIDDLETGIPASKITLSAGYIQELAAYAGQRFGVRQKLALKIGYAIAKKHEKEGMPTAASYQFSKTGQRTRAIETSYNENENQYNRIIEKGTSNEVDLLIDKTFDETVF